MDEKEKLEQTEDEQVAQVPPTEDNQPAEDTQASAEQEQPVEEPEVQSEPEMAQEPEQQPEPQPEAEPAEKMIPQSEVNDLIGKVRQETREKAMLEAKRQTLQELIDRYGLDDEDGLNSLFGDGQRYQALNDEYGSQAAKLKEVETENVLLKSGVDRSRFSDVVAILEYNHLEVTPETVEQMKLTHPEWTSETEGVKPAVEFDETGEVKEPVKPSVVRKLGVSPAEPGSQTSPEDEEKAQALKLLGL